MLSIKIFSRIFAMIHLYSLSLVALQITLRQSGLKQQIFIISDFLWPWGQEFGGGSAERLWLRVFHEVAVKMLAGASVI